MLISCVQTVAQLPMTIGEAFDFDVGDEFHNQNMDGSDPPSGEQSVITSKYISITADTLKYGRTRLFYTSAVVWTPTPHLEYSCSSYSDTLVFYNANSQIDQTVNHFTYDTLWAGVGSCGIVVNAFKAPHDTATGPNQQYRKSYGKGLGWIYDFFDDPTLIGSYREWRMVYHIKSTGACGAPDNSCVVGINEHSLSLNIKAYPNPCNEILNLQLPFQEQQVQLHSTDGKLMTSFNVFGSEHSLDLSRFPAGIYYLVVQNNAQVVIKQLVKE
jgi:hypothetical protein